MWICLRVSLLLLLLPIPTLGQSNRAEEPPGSLSFSAAAPDRVDRVQESLGFASFLMQEGEYYRAITEFNRVLYLSGTDDQESRSAAILGVGQALHAGRQYERAGEWLWQHLEALSAAGRLADGVALMSRSFLDGNAGSRLLVLTGEQTFPAQEVSLYRSLALANIGRWEDAYAGFRDISEQSQYGSLASFDADMAHRAVNATWKSPKLAGWLGIIPGLGYAYADHKQTAAASFIVNTVFWIATYQAFRTDQNVLGGLLTAFSVSWYSGNIYGSVQAAKRYNTRLQNELWSTLRY